MAANRRRGRRHPYRIRSTSIQPYRGGIGLSQERDWLSISEDEFPLVEGAIEFDTSVDPGWGNTRWGPNARRILRCLATAIGHAKQNLSAESLYQLVLTAEQQRKARGIRLMDSKGSLKGVFRSKDGKIHSIVNLKKVNPQTATALVALPMYQAMEEMISKLENIESGIKEILRGQHADRIGELRAGMEMTQHAALVDEIGIRMTLLQSAVPVLLLAKWKLFETMRRELKQMHDEIGEGRLIPGLRDNLDPSMSRAQIASRYMQKLHENMAGATQATIELASVYSDLGEPRAAVSLVEKYVDSVEEVRPYVDVGLKYMTAKGDLGRIAFPFWKQLEPNLEQLPALARSACAADDRPLLLSFEGSEILRLQEGNDEHE